jgi:hypothetical protein
MSEMQCGAMPKKDRVGQVERAVSFSLTRSRVPKCLTWADKPYERAIHRRPGQLEIGCATKRYPKANLDIGQLL